MIAEEQHEQESSRDQQIVHSTQGGNREKERNSQMTFNDKGYEPGTMQS